MVKLFCTFYYKVSIVNISHHLEIMKVLHLTFTLKMLKMYMIHYICLTYIQTNAPPSSCPVPDLVLMIIFVTLDHKRILFLIA